MGTTPAGLPYPEPSDLIAEGANAIRALAEAWQTGIATLSGTNVATGGAISTNITFPNPFEAPPNIAFVVKLGFVTNSIFFVASYVDQITATGLRIVMHNLASQSLTVSQVPVRWFAARALA